MQTVFSPADLPATLYLDGIGSVFTFGNLRLNDKFMPEIYRVREVAGLESPDVRDARELLPGQDGEYPYDAFYGGRSIVLTGEIEAGNWAMLTHLRERLLRETNSLEEQTLTISRVDWADNFEPPLWAYSSYTIDAGAISDVGVVSGQRYLDAVANLSTAKRFVYSLRQYLDQYARIVATPGATITSFKAGVILKRTASNTYLEVYVDDNGTNSRLRIDRVVGGVTTNVATTNLTSRVANGTEIVIVGKIVGDTVAAYAYSSVPAYGAVASPLATLSAASGDSGSFGSAIKGNAGWSWIPQHTDAKLSRFEIWSLGPYDVWTKARRAQPPQIGPQQNSPMVERPFQISFRASEPRLLSKYQESTTTTVVTAGALGRVYDRTYDLSYSSYIDGTGSPIASGNGSTLTNLGNYKSAPIIRLYGEMVNPVLTHVGTGKKLEFSGTIPANDFWEINVADRTVLDSSGVNKFAALSFDSDWILLDPGANELDLSVSSFDSAYYECYFHHAWL